ncbi:tRNA-dihydrouridine synthase family protein [Fusibacter ferrireducens]|uniref:tRNA-dihydrouridine synthase n=1 Tax=Fusibacter ferrireducens TaxID=2785058 RepID=A0ABR9ZPP5_9FIRM|nr:tRNA-dihydrouridine synthase family protein [Fusibacter ferrireducens]MBF4692435.1 tRNA-dihydrouridine synthase family protein [Fusibacter ferrireducens]
MQFYYAPLEGVVGHVYRNAHKANFKYIDKYFAPFIVSDQKKGFSTKDLDDILLENNNGLILVPQILSNNASDFIHTAQKINQMGYSEINLNLGCPSKKVVSKNRGSGFLAHKEALNAFLDDVYSSQIAQHVAFSIKTRLGKTHPDEFYALIEIFNRYPVKELIIHPRIQTDIYHNKPNLKVFKEALSLSQNPLCYNGDIFTVSDYTTFTNAFPEVKAMMLGRGLLANPDLVNAIKTYSKIDKSVLKAFHDDIYAGYRQSLMVERNVLSKMKEIWYYLIQSFTNNETYLKVIRAAISFVDYEAVVERLFEEQEIDVHSGYSQ